jgi:dienelactone hydrolase
VAEAPHSPEAPAALWCTTTGQVLTEPGGRTGRALLRAFAAARIPAPADPGDVAGARAERDRVRRRALDVLGAVPPLTGEPPRALPPAVAGGLRVERLILQARLDVLLPALLFHPPPGAAPPETTAPPGGRYPAVLLLDDRGKAASAGDGALAPALARAGALALTADLRGWGETVWRDETFNWSPERHTPLSADTMLANVGLMLGRWAVTQRVQDVLGLLAYLRSRPDVDPRRLVLVGRGGGGIVALHAAAVDGEVAGVAVYESLVSYRSVVDAPDHAHSVADFLPGVLLHYDLPDLAAALAPRPLLVAAPRDAMNRPLDPAVAGAAYDRPGRLAALLGGALTLDPTPEVAPQRIARWAAAVPAPAEVARV